MFPVLQSVAVNYQLVVFLQTDIFEQSRKVSLNQPVIVSTRKKKLKHSLLICSLLTPIKE